jgi:CO dehydrogenase nickel-insertion accessory protein CooC1
MIVTCGSVKGGSGTSVVAGGLAVAWAADRPVLAVDLAGDLPSVIGIGAPPGPGVLDWLAAGSGVGVAALEALAVDAGPGLRVLHRGGSPDGGSGDVGADEERWQGFADAMATVRADVVIDAGLAPLPRPLAAGSDASLLVIRPCFLALRRASMATDVPAGVVVIAEPGRSLGRRDVERVLGIRTAAEIRLDPAVARAADCGLLAARLPGSLAQLAKAVDRWAAGAAVGTGRAVAEPLPGLEAARPSGALLAPEAWAGWR